MSGTSPPGFSKAYRLSPFYTRYLDADGLPMLASDEVDDEAFLRPSTPT